MIFADILSISHAECSAGIQSLSLLALFNRARFYRIILASGVLVFLVQLRPAQLSLYLKKNRPRNFVFVSTSVQYIIGILFSTILLRIHTQIASQVRTSSNKLEVIVNETSFHPRVLHYRFNGTELFLKSPLFSIIFDQKNPEIASSLASIDRGSFQQSEKASRYRDNCKKQFFEKKKVL